MKTSTERDENMDDLVFAHRNKSYGAFQIRSEYPHALRSALLIVYAGSVTLFLCAYLYTQNSIAKFKFPESIPPVQEIIRSIEFKTLDQNKTKAAAGKTSSAAKGEKSASSTLVRDEVTTRKDTLILNSVASLSLPAETALGKSGNGNAGDSLNGDLLAKGNGGTGTVKNDFEVDKLPEYEGGLAALYAFLRKNLNYPEEAYSAQTEGTVFVKFVVDEKGKIVSPGILHKAGFGMDEEALRVVSLLPPFKSPAYFAGAPTKVNYQVKIRFSIR
ncbi:MAG TPA: energy transducer TonB [Bacteroidia bacterium]|nr:energy transducer TonB [Bacteroidia bacterium]